MRQHLAKASTRATTLCCPLSPGLHVLHCVFLFIVVRTIPEQVLLRRAYFINPRQNKYVSLGFYPQCDHVPHDELGSSRQDPIVLSPYMFSSLAMHIPKLCSHLCRNKPYKCSELGFLLLNNHKARVKINKRSIELPLEEVNYLFSNMVFLQNQLARYELSVTGLKDYVTSVKGSKTFIEPQRDASPYILYGELKSTLVQ